MLSKDRLKDFVNDFYKREDFLLNLNVEANDEIMGDE